AAPLQSSQPELVGIELPANGRIALVGTSPDGGGGDTVDDPDSSSHQLPAPIALPTNPIRAKVSAVGIVKDAVYNAQDELMTKSRPCTVPAPNGAAAAAVAPVLRLICSVGEGRSVFAHTDTVASSPGSTP